MIAAIVFGSAGIAVGYAAASGMLAAPFARLAALASAPGASAGATLPAIAVASPPAREGAHSTAASTAPRSAPSRRRGKGTDLPVASRAAQKGSMKVTAPGEAEVFLDGRRVGKGDVQTDVPAGAHRIEVRLGKARVAERFTVAAGETWTYDVTPTR
jgi:hypothetical protein